MRRAEGFYVSFDDGRQERLRLGQTPDARELRGQVALHRERVGMRRPQGLGAQSHGALQVEDGRVDLAELGVHGAEHVADLAFHGRHPGEASRTPSMIVQLARGHVEDLAQRHVASGAALARRPGSREEVLGEELVDGARDVALARRLLGRQSSQPLGISRTLGFALDVHEGVGELAVRAVGPHEPDRGSGGSDDQRDQHGADGRHGQAVARGELAHAVGEARRRGIDRQAVQEALDLVRELVGARVATHALLLQAPHHDPIEVGRDGANAGLARRRSQPAARQRRVRLRDGADELGEAERVRVEGGIAGEQLVHQYAQRVDVRARVDVALERGLLGTHVGRRADELSFDRDRVLGQRPVDRLGDAEVDDLGARPSVDLDHDHVGGLEVAVDDALLVRVVHRVAHLAEQLQGLGQTELVAATVVGDRLARQVLHGEPRLAGLRRAGVEHAGDGGVLHARQGLALGVEACAGGG